MTSACLSQTSKAHVHHNTLEKSKAFQMLKTCRLSRVYILAKGDKDVTSAYCSKRRIRMRACHAHVLNPHLLFFSLSPVNLSLERFLGTYATDDFDLLIPRPIYILLILLPDTFLNLLKEYFISSILFHLSKLIKQLLFDIINLS